MAQPLLSPGGHAHSWDPVYQVDPGVPPAHQVRHRRPHLPPTCRPAGSKRLSLAFAFPPVVISECFRVALEDLMETCLEVRRTEIQEGKQHEVWVGAEVMGGDEEELSSEVGLGVCQPESRPGSSTCELCDLWQVPSYLCACPP